MECKYCKKQITTASSYTESPELGNYHVDCDIAVRKPKQEIMKQANRWHAAI